MMRIGTLCVVASLLAPVAYSLAQTKSVCSQVMAAYEQTRVSPSKSGFWIRRFFAIITFSDDSRLTNDDERVGAIENVQRACQQVDNDPTKSADQKNEWAKGWIEATITFRRPSSENEVPRLLFAGLGLLASDLSSGWRRHTLLQLAAAIDEGLPAPPLPPLRGAITLKVFPKRNLGLDQILRLRTLLPDFDIRQGRSGLSGSTYSADVLFVNRGRVSQGDVLAVARALQEVDVRIKSVQQRTRGHDQIQIGTIVPSPGQPAFGNSEPLDLQTLAALTGDAFWTAAFNGQAWCNTGIETTVRCSISADGRPVPTNGRLGVRRAHP
jgi:hypothetical protein